MNTLIRRPLSTPAARARAAGRMATGANVETRPDKYSHNAVFPRPRERVRAGQKPAAEVATRNTAGGMPLSTILVLTTGRR